MEHITTLLRRVLGERTFQKLAQEPDIRRIGTLQVSDLQGTYGLTEKQADKVHAAFELSRALHHEPLRRGQLFRCAADVVKHFGPRMRDLQQEEFHVIYLDAKHRVMETRMITRGLLSTSPVHPREVIAPALTMRAAVMILVHNHPSGDPSPSADDIDVTRRLRDCGDLVGIQVADHIIIGDVGYASLLDRGLLL